MVGIRRCGFSRPLRHTATLAAMVTLGVVVALLTQRMVIPAPVQAQQAVQGDIQATSFTLVGQDGSRLAQLRTGLGGGGVLLLFDSTGRERLDVTASGSLIAYDTDGKTVRFAAGYTVNPNRFAGIPAFNGLLLDPNGTTSYLPASP